MGNAGDDFSAYIPNQVSDFRHWAAVSPTLWLIGSNRILDCHGNLETVFPRKMTASVFSASSLKQNLLIFKGQSPHAAVGIMAR